MILKPIFPKATYDTHMHTHTNRALSGEKKNGMKFVHKRGSLRFKQKKSFVLWYNNKTICGQDQFQN